MRVIPPVTSVSPDWYFLGVSPKRAPAAFDFLIRCGSSTADLNVIATNAPTPGTVMNWRQTLSSRTILPPRCSEWVMCPARLGPSPLVPSLGSTVAHLFVPTCRYPKPSCRAAVKDGRLAEL